MAKTTKVNLAKLFGTVASELAKNQSTLNQADTQNNDHGDHMVSVFNTITQAIQEKPKGSPTSQLEYAAEQVRENCQNGSGNVYADGLARAAQELQGQNIDATNAMQLITALMGTNMGGQGSAQPGNADALGSLLGAMMGGSTQQQSTAGAGSSDALSSMLGGLMGAGQTSGTGSNAQGDMISSLLGGLLGGEQAPSQSGSGSGISMQQVLAAGLEFMQSQQQGQDTMSSLLDAVVAGSQAGGGYREESGKLVAGALMQGLGALMASKK